MYNFIEEFLKEARDDINGLSLWTVDNKLLNVDQESPRLAKKDADYFYRMMARLLFASRQARPDIQVATKFLCIRIKDPTEKDYKKLARVMKYLRNIIHLPLLINCDESGMVIWSVDAASVVHDNMHSHT